MSEMAFNYGKESKTVTKIERFGWTIKDSAGSLIKLDKNFLKVHPDYQRKSVDSKIRAIASSWSWIACGAIIVGHRNNEYWVIDGQHRVLAAKCRADIKELPCVVFETFSVQQEAIGFLDVNAGRKPVPAIDRFNAKIAANDEVAIYVRNTCLLLGITIKGTAHKPMETKSISWAVKWARADKDAFFDVMKLSAEMCKDSILYEILLDGLMYIHMNCDVNLKNQRLTERIKTIGAVKLVESAKRASAYFVKGGAKVWANAMIDEMNKGLRIKYKLIDK